MNLEKKTTKFCEYKWVIVIWFFITLWNINKAYHIDDPYYLEVAQWIQINPLQPMSGLTNWYDRLEPFFKTNNPILFQYIQSFWGRFFLYSEISSHILISIFLFWLLIRFFQLAKEIGSKRPVFLTFIFGACPALLISQNAMLDIPLLAFWIEFFYILLNKNINENKKFFFASLVSSLAFLIKYTAILLFPALIIYIFLIKKYKNLLWLLLPVLLISLWCLLNFLEFETIHFFSLPKKHLSFSIILNSVIGILVYLGVLLTIFIILILKKIFLIKKKNTKFFFLLLISLIFLINPILLFFNVFFSLNVIFFNNFFFLVSLFSGLIIFIFFIEETLKKISNHKFLKEDIILFYWILSVPLFIILFSPFLATRHLLLMIPALILFFNNSLSTAKINKNLCNIIIATYLFTGIVYAKSDYWYASIYKSYASEISKAIKYKEKNNYNIVVWFKGSWGWQWYAKKNGFKHYTSGVSRPNVGDILILPENVWGTQAPNELNLKLIYEYKVERHHWFKKFSMIWFYSYYSFFNNDKKFYSNDFAENFRIYKIISFANNTEKNKSF